MFPYNPVVSVLLKFSLFRNSDEFICSGVLSSKLFKNPFQGHLWFLGFSVSIFSICCFSHDRRICSECLSSIDLGCLSAAFHKVSFTGFNFVLLILLCHRPFEHIQWNRPPFLIFLARTVSEAFSSLLTSFCIVFLVSDFRIPHLPRNVKLIF